ncbi:hypothetical protein BLNAU_8011 [Blattamonas nauphoetae]|uniref:Uncharacterized protein n=1 Tax=Blattamonas nauphoetae TaxID=2049346 RepID=A0ABQ9XZN0_9EUKA|nr:hypothetical protein BLNAU_8011 [Blattamonas nauphoetae]
MNCSPFLNWREDSRDSIHSKAVIFRSLVATLKSHPALDVSLEAKAVEFLQDEEPQSQSSADAFLGSFESSSGDSSTSFVQCIAVLISSGSQAITTTAMKMLSNLIWLCSDDNLLLLVKADLISELVITLNPQSLSFTEAVDIHTYLISTITYPLRLTTPEVLTSLTYQDDNEQQAACGTILKQVLAPSEKYIWHLCVNRYSIIDDDMSENFLLLLARLLQICPSYQQTMDFVLHLPVLLTIPSCLAFFEKDESIRYCLLSMIDNQREWNKKGGEQRQMWKTVHRMLRLEGIEDVIEGKQRNDRKTDLERLIVTDSIEWYNLQGLNHPEWE